MKSKSIYFLGFLLRCLYLLLCLLWESECGGQGVRIWEEVRGMRVLCMAPGIDSGVKS